MSEKKKKKLIKKRGEDISPKKISDQMREVDQSCPTLRPHESQHARPPYPSPTPRVHSDSRPSSQWCHPAISSSGIPFSSCAQSLPASESFPMSQLFACSGQSTGVSALASFLPKKSQGWSLYFIFIQSTKSYFVYLILYYFLLEIVYINRIYIHT